QMERAQKIDRTIFLGGEPGNYIIDFDIESKLTGGFGLRFVIVHPYGGEAFLPKNLQPFAASAAKIDDSEFLLISILQEGYVARIFPEPDQDFFPAAAIAVFELAIEEVQKGVFRTISQLRILRGLRGHQLPGHVDI